MTSPQIIVATPQDRPRILASLVAAFVDDPVLRHLFPDDATYPQHAAAFFGVLFDRRVRRSTVWTTADGTSASLWDAPGPDDAAADGGGDPFAWLPDDVHARVLAYDEAVHPALPTGPHWYLGVLATHPDHAGRGLARAVIRTGLERADADGLPVVLETSKPRNVELYRRWGFEVREHLTEPVPIWVMER